MDRQTIFNTVYTKLMEQGCRAIDPVYGNCAYLVNGLRCAIGHLIPEGHKAEDVNCSASALVERFPDLKELFGVKNDEDVRFLVDMQSAHDSASDRDFKEGFQFAMKEIADDIRFNLTVPE